MEVARRGVVWLVAGVLVVLLAAVPGSSHAAQGSVLPLCAYGSDVPGLPGYLQSAVDRAASDYASQVSGGAAAQTRARQAFAAAAAAYVYGLPQVTERATIKHFPHNEIISVAALADPSVRTVVAPNVDTAYTTSWLDLTDGPIVINVPDTAGRFYTFQFLDAFTNAFSYVGTGSTGTHAGAYVLVPPGYTGALPAGATPIHAPSNTIWLLGRTLVRDSADLPAVKQLQEQYEATPLSAWESGARQPPVVVDHYPPTIPKSIPSGSQFIATLNNEMNIDPPPPADTCALKAMAPAGVQVPHPTPAQTLLADTSDEAPPLPAVAGDPVTNAAVSAGTSAAAQVIAGATDKLNAASRNENRGWEILGNWVGAYGTRYLGRAIVATDLLAANTPQQTIYPIADTDIRGRTLNASSHRYTITFRRGQLPPVHAFWSLTMYDANYFLYANPINRYAVGDRTSGLHYARNGSVTFYVQHNAPSTAAARANWLPAPAARFHLILRLYQPKPAALSGRWKPAPVVRDDELAPLLSRLVIHPRRFRAAPRGGVIARRRGRARVSYRDSQASPIRFTLLRVRHRRHCHGRRCSAYHTVARFRRRDRAGANHFFITGRAHGHRLRPGTYVLRAVAGGAGGIPRSRTRSARFRIRPR